MEFNIRAIAMHESVPADARVEVSDCIGREIVFRTGISLSITLPAEEQGFAALPDPRIILNAIPGWTRIFQSPVEGGRLIHVVGLMDDQYGQIVFLRLDLLERNRRKGPRPPVEILGGAVMNYDSAADWLIDLAHEWGSRPDEANKQRVLVRPFRTRLNHIKLGWVGPELVGGVPMSPRLSAIGSAFGAEIVRVAPISYRHVKSSLNQAGPLQGVIICRSYAPYITDSAVPESLDKKLIHFCDSTDHLGLETQIKAWLEICDQAAELARGERTMDEKTFLLRIMLRGMLSHAKIGQFKHCQRETVLTGVRSRRLNVAFAEAILGENSEEFRDTADSGTLFLWKDHNDGRRYFLNPKRMGEIEAIARPGKDILHPDRCELGS